MHSIKLVYPGSETESACKGLGSVVYRDSYGRPLDLPCIGGLGQTVLVHQGFTVHILLRTHPTSPQLGTHKAKKEQLGKKKKKEKEKLN